MKKFMVILILGLCTFSLDVHAAGLLTPKDGSLPELSIKDHKVRVVLEDGYAITTVDQVFHNPNDMDLEAVYSFPVPDKAAVSEFTMWIDGTPINGEVLEKNKARQVYEDQKAQGNDTGLTEKNEYKTFEISVSPVRASQDVKIRLSYIQPAHVDTNIGRYVYPLEEGGVDEEAMAFWSMKDVVESTFSFDLVLRSDYPVELLRLPNHANAQITQNGDQWIVHLDNYAQGQTAGASTDADILTLDAGVNVNESTEVADVVINSGFRLDTDIVVYYRHASNLPGAVDLVAYKEEGADRGTFMMTITPGIDLQPITEGQDWAFVLDISGSMQGKYATLAEGVLRTLKQLSPNDRFRIILFNDRARELTSGYANATPENIERYSKAVASIHPDNGTNVYDGLKQALDKLDADRTSSIILVTDGVANVGETHQKKFIELIKKKDVRLFTFIMGNSANRPLLEAMTRASNGFALSVSNSDDIIGKILLAKSKVTHEALHGVKVMISGVKTTDVTPDNIGSLYRGEQMIVFGHYFGDGPVDVVFKVKISGEEKEYKSTFDLPDVDERNPEVERLWAYATIENMMEEIRDFGENSDIKQSITDIGVEYSLVTDYTSMVVVKEAVFKKLGIDRRNQKRLQKEYSARQKRTSNTVRQRRVDTAKPMFNIPRASGGGAGAMGPEALLFLSPFLFGARRRKKGGSNE